MGIIWDKTAEFMKFFSGYSRDPVRIGMLGLDAAGKTTILYKLKLNEVVSTIPLTGIHIETVSPCEGDSFTVWDIDGKKQSRTFWRHYLHNFCGILYVVDSNDTTRFDESRDELMNVLASDDMRYVPVVVLANKQDLPGAAKLSHVVDAMHLKKLTNRKWHIQGTCATTGEGLIACFLELSKLVKDYERTKRRTRPP